MTLGAKIRTLREHRRWTQGELATRLGWEQASGRISNYEKDLREPSLTDLRRLARIFGKPVSHFVDDEPLPGVPDAAGQVAIDANLFAAALDEAENVFARADAEPDTLQRVKMAISYYEEYIELRQGRAGRDLSDWEPPHPEP